MLAEAGATRWLRDHVGHRLPDGAAAALTPLRRVREGLRQMAIANNGGKLETDVVAHADAALRRAPIIVSLSEADPDPAAHSTASIGTVEGVLTTVAIAYLSSRIGGAWRRVKACAEPDCRWAFLDLSRNASRRWCDMSECGNRAKNRAWRSRQNSPAV